jgi:amidase
MPVPPSTPQDLQEMASTFNIVLSDAEAEEYLEHVATTLDAYAALDHLDEGRPSPPEGRDPGAPPDRAENPVNGWVWRCSIKGASGGPLSGRTVAIKDNTAVAGLPLGLGSPVMNGYVADEDATVVKRLLAAGAEIVGKTAVPAFCFDGGGFVGGFDPPVLNPADHSRVPGGSSSGSAAVVANGEVDMALGGDQGGSIRLPASFSGCCGHKPTYGLVPYTGIFPLERTLDHAGPLARTVADCAAMLEAIAGPDGLDPRQSNIPPVSGLTQFRQDLKGIRVGVLAEGFGIEGASEDEVDRTVRDTALALRQAGADVTECSVPLHRDGPAIWNAIVVQGCADLVIRGDGVGTNAGGPYPTGVAEFFARARREPGGVFPPTLCLTLLVAEHVTRECHHDYYAKGRNLARVLRDDYDRALADVDVLVMPTTAMRAFARPPAGAPLGEIFAAALGNLHNTSPFNVTGHPALSVPVPKVAGLPIGLQIVGRHFEDATVLSVGHAVEHLL